MNLKTKLLLAGLAGTALVLGGFAQGTYQLSKADEAIKKVERAQFSDQAAFNDNSITSYLYIKVKEIPKMSATIDDAVNRVEDLGWEANATEVSKANINALLDAMAAAQINMVRLYIGAPYYETPQELPKFTIKRQGGTNYFYSLTEKEKDGLLHALKNAKEDYWASLVPLGIPKPENLEKMTDAQLKDVAAKAESALAKEIDNRGIRDFGGDSYLSAELAELTPLGTPRYTIPTFTKLGDGFSLNEKEGKEAKKEAAKPENERPAVNVQDKPAGFTQKALIAGSAYFVGYDSPLAVDFSCLEKKVKEYSSGDIGIAPRLNGNKLLGFQVWAKRAGAGYSWMNQDILALGKACEVSGQ